MLWKCDYNSFEGLYLIKEMIEELKSIIEYVYCAYTREGEIKKFSEKQFDLKTLSIIDKKLMSIYFFKGRINGLVFKLGTNKIDEYQTVMKAVIGIYGMAAALSGDIWENSSMATSDMIYPLIYTYLDYMLAKIIPPPWINNLIKILDPCL